MSDASICQQMTCMDCRSGALAVTYPKDAFILRVLRKKNYVNDTKMEIYKMTGAGLQCIDIIYIDDFWDARMLSASDSITDADFVNIETKKILQNLRLYSIFFKTIYISRLHLIHFTSKLHYNIVQSVFSDSFFRYLVESGIIKISIRQNIDGYSDNERLKERSLSAGGLLEEINTNLILSTIKNASSHIIESHLWGNNTQHCIKSILTNQQIIDHNLSEKIFNDSLDNEGVFLFEKFYFNIVSLVNDRNISKSIIYNTSQVYLELPNEYEWEFITVDKIPRALGKKKFHNVSKLERWLFSPEAFIIFLRLFWTDSDIYAFLTCSAETIEKIRGNRYSNYPCLTSLDWNKFRKDYQKMALYLSDVIYKRNEISLLNSQSKNLDYEQIFKMAGQWDIFGSLDASIDATLSAVASVNPIEGGASQVTRAITKNWLSNQFFLMQWKLKFPDILYYIKDIRRLIQNTNQLRR